MGQASGWPITKRFWPAASRRGSLEHQTATAEVLRIIASSSTDEQPVLDAVAESAARVCDAMDVYIRLVQGDRFLIVSHHGSIAITGLGFGRGGLRGI